MKGWIRIHRSITDNKFYFSEEFTRMQAWIDLLILANIKDSFYYVRGVKIVVNRGSLAYSMETLAERWRWTPGKVKRFLITLKNEGQIDVQISNITTTISICNYEYYQPEQRTNGGADDGQTTSRRKHNNIDLAKIDGEDCFKKEGNKIPDEAEFVSYCESNNLNFNHKKKYDELTKKNWNGRNGPIGDWKAYAKAISDKNNETESKAASQRKVEYYDGNFDQMKIATEKEFKKEKKMYPDKIEFKSYVD